MAGTRRYFRIFLASPGDLLEERQAAKQVVDEFNEHFAEVFGYQAELVGWENTLPGVGRPQAIINRDLDNCDLFVGLLWKRWEHRQITAGITSGFEEEFDISIKRHECDGRPQIHLLLKCVDESALIDPGEQLKKVEAFKAKVFSERKLLAKKFADVVEFERVLRASIAGFAKELKTQEVAEEPQRSLPTEVSNSAIGEETSGHDRSGLPLDGISFLGELIEDIRSPSVHAPQAHDIARFRLISKLLSATGNDEETLGAHDANIMFRHWPTGSLTLPEYEGLLHAGLEHYLEENAPLWSWLIAADGSPRNLLILRSLSGATSAQKVGALTAMRLIGENLRDDFPLTREQIIRSWLEKDSAVKAVALRYLEDWGLRDDINLLLEEVRRCNFETEEPATNAVLEISLREMPERSFSILLELIPSRIGERTLKKLFAMASPDSDVLKRLLSCQNSGLRSHALLELIRRNDMEVSTAEKLLGDHSALIRFESLRALVAAGKVITLEQAKELLVNKQKSPDRSLFAMATMGDKDGDAYYESFVSQQKLTLSESALLQEMESDLYEHDAFFALAKKNPGVYRDKLKLAVADRFAEIFNERLLRIRNGPNSDYLIHQFQKLSEFLRARATRRGLTILQADFDSVDLTLVRQLLQSAFIQRSVSDIEYLRRCGNWSDIPLVADFSTNLVVKSDAIDIFCPERVVHDLVAGAIFALGAGRLPELLILDLPSQISLRLLRTMPDRDVHEMPSELLQTLLLSNDEKIRKTIAIRIITNLPRDRVQEMLSMYLEAKQFYYNVIHWLDFGLSVPRQTMLRGAAFALRQM